MAEKNPLDRALCLEAAIRLIEENASPCRRLDSAVNFCRREAEELKRLVNN